MARRALIERDIRHGSPVVVVPGSADGSASPVARSWRARDPARAARLRSRALIFPRNVRVQHLRWSVWPNFRTVGVPTLIGFPQDGQAGARSAPQDMQKRARAGFSAEQFGHLLPSMTTEHRR